MAECVEATIRLGLIANVSNELVRLHGKWTASIALASDSIATPPLPVAGFPVLRTAAASRG